MDIANVNRSIVARSGASSVQRRAVKLSINDGISPPGYSKLQNTEPNWDFSKNKKQESSKSLKQYTVVSSNNPT
jgi:hypothetical protein